MSLSDELAGRMLDDDDLVEDLAAYHGEPAVLIADTGGIPEDVPRPFVVVVEPIADDAFDTKTTTGRDVTRPIRIYDDASGDTSRIERIAERVRVLFHRQPAGLLDEDAFLAECRGPFTVPTDRALYGREVQLRLVSLSTPGGS